MRTTASAKLRKIRINLAYKVVDDRDDPAGLVYDGHVDVEEFARSKQSVLRFGQCVFEVFSGLYDMQMNWLEGRKRSRRDTDIKSYLESKVIYWKGYSDAEVNLKVEKCDQAVQCDGSDSEDDVFLSVRAERMKRECVGSDSDDDVPLSVRAKRMKRTDV